MIKVEANGNGHNNAQWAMVRLSALAEVERNTADALRNFQLLKVSMITLRAHNLALMALLRECLPILKLSLSESDLIERVEAALLEE